MDKTLKIQKSMLPPESHEISVLLESLDNNSRILAKTYLTALADRDRMEKAKQTAMVVGRR